VIASAAGIVLGALAVRHFIGPEAIQGGALPVFPSGPTGFLHELLSGVRTTALGGAQPASPALAALGAVSWASFASAALAQKVVLGALVPLAAILAYRSFARQTRRPGSAVVASAAYVLSGVGLWAFSEGRIGVLVGLATLPVVWERLDGAFGRRGFDRPVRSTAGLGVAIAIAIAFAPGMALAAGLMAAVHVVGARRRARGSGLTILATTAAAMLAFPIVADIVAAPDRVLSSFVGTTDPWSVLRLAPGDGPGAWLVSAFLPVSALICFAAASGEQRARAWRAAAVAVSGTALAWASAAGYLPQALSNPPAYLTAAAFAEAAVVVYGAPALVSNLERQAFGVRQLAAALLTVVLAVGLGAQALQVTLAEWEVRPNGLPPAWPVIDSVAPGEFRILWLGAPPTGRFPAPGGDPIGIVGAGDASVRFGLTDRHGASALDVGRRSFGPGYERLRSSLGELLSGGTTHAGAMLGPFGIRYVIAGPSDLPSAALDRLEAQADLDRVPAGGLVIFQNAAVLPPTFVASGEGWASAAEADDLRDVAARPVVPVERIPAPETGAATSVDEPAEVVAADQFDPGWRIRIDDERLAPRRAFGWAISASVGPGRASFIYTDQWVRTAEMWALAALWLAALWITRKPVSS
jgi:hypothetical protein